MMPNFKPQILLSTISRERCVEKLKELPALHQLQYEPKNTAAVLVPLCVVNNEVSLLYTLRSLKLKSHSGQVSFPGGKKDSGETSIETALRETQEELGLDPSQIDIWGTMPQIQGRDKNMIVTPVVGYIKNFELKNLVPNPDEVEEVFTCNIRDLCDPTKHAHFEYLSTPMPIYLHEKHKVWGMTGIITHFLLTCLVPEDLYQNGFMRKSFTMEQLLPAKL